MPRATGLGSSDDLGVALGCSAVPLFLGGRAQSLLLRRDVTSDSGCVKASGEMHGRASHSTPKLSFPGVNWSLLAGLPSQLSGVFFFLTHHAAQNLELLRPSVHTQIFAYSKV